MFITFALYKNKMKQYTAFALLALLYACNGGKNDDDALTVVNDPVFTPAPQLNYNILNVYPHDTGAYTQGLQLHNGKMYEGTGDFANSSLRITDYKTGKVEKKHQMGSDKIFGEGITIFNGKIYQLTWESNIVYVYDLKNIDKPIKIFTWPYDGWGITNNGTELIISDGTANIYFVNAEDFTVKRRISVNVDGVMQNAINELEFAEGFIFANVYESNFILKIDPATGKVAGMLDLPADLIEKHAPGFTPKPQDEVLNGIAYDSTSKKFFITGKRWPKLFEVTIQ
jgi:glutamine cyclotransferase